MMRWACVVIRNMMGTEVLVLTLVTWQELRWACVVISNMTGNGVGFLFVIFDGNTN
jgi:hypothetical protein